MRMRVGIAQRKAYAPIGLRRLVGGLAAVALLIGPFGLSAGAQPDAQPSAQDVCSAIQELPLSGGAKEALCRDFQAGIARGHLRPERALQFIREVGARITDESRSTAEGLLALVGRTVNPATGDLPAEVLIRRSFEVFSREEAPEEALSTALHEATALQRALGSVAAVYRGLGIFLEPNVSEKTLETAQGAVQLTVPRVDTVITATVVALDRFERRLDRRLDDTQGMKAEVMKELRAPSFYGAQALPEELVAYIDAQTDGREWAPIVRQLAADRGRNS